MVLELAVAKKIKFKCSDFSLAELGHLPLDELLGQEESFLPPAEVTMHITSCQRCKILLFLLGSVVFVEGQMCESPPSIPTPW